MAATPEMVRAAVEKYLDAWGSDNREKLLSLYADDGIFVDPVGTREYIGPAQIGEFWDMAHQAPGTRLYPKIEELRVCANEAILRFTMQVRREAEGQGMNLSVIEYLVVNDEGKIANLRAFWDNSHFSVPEGLKPLG